MAWTMKRWLFTPMGAQENSVTQSSPSMILKDSVSPGSTVSVDSTR